MHIQFNLALGTYTAVDNYGVVLSIYDPQVHGQQSDWAHGVRGDFTMQ